MSRLVYSTGPDGNRSAKPDAGPAREPSASLPPAEHDIRVRRTRAGRRGKTVTVSGPFVLSRADAMALLKSLKRSCGSGGTLKPCESKGGGAAFELEMQGDHVERLVAALVKSGYRAKRSGG